MDKAIGIIDYGAGNLRSRYHDCEAELRIMGNLRSWRCTRCYSCHPAWFNEYFDSIE